jgi:hypothetical protein
MKVFDSVLSFGDSHIAGCELSSKYTVQELSQGKVTLEDIDQCGKELSFPKIIADELGIPSFNYSMSGGSNARSIRKLIEVIQNHPNSLVLFGYTAIDRYEFYFPDPDFILGRDADNFVQVGGQWSHTGRHQIINKCYLKILRSYNNLRELMFIVDNICTNYASDFIHLPLFPDNLPNIKKLYDFKGIKIT